MKTMTYLGFLSVPLCFCQHLQAQNNSRPTNPPNIIFILADDMGYGDVSAFNEHSGITTRNLDEMADNGVSFTDAPARPLVRLPAMGLSPEDITGVQALKAVYYMDIHAPLSLLREAQWLLC